MARLVNTDLANYPGAVAVASLQLDAELLRVSKANKSLLDAYREGVSLEARSQLTIRQLQHHACADRIRLADSFLIAARKLMRTRPAQYRSAISRNYYAMYQAARAAVYFVHDGDDHEAHSSLPKQFPNDFPSASYWQNQLKDARLRRNEADYDAYPSSNSYFRRVALDTSSEAPNFVNLCRSYLRSKGCSHV